MRPFLLLAAGLTTLAAAPALAQTAPMTPPTATPAPLPTPAPSATPAPMTSPSPTAMPAPTTAPPSTEATATAPITPIEPSVGATVYGAAGTPVGTIKALDAQYVTLATDKGEVRLPVAGVGPGLKGPVIGLTAAQLDAAVGQAQAAQPAAAATTTTRTTRSTRRTRRR